MPTDQRFEIRSRRKSYWFWLANEFVDMGCLKWPESMLKIYLFYVRSGSGQGKCCASMADIVEATGFDKRTIRRANQALCTAGAIHVESGRGRGHFTVVYLLEFPTEKGASGVPVFSGKGDRKEDTGVPFYPVKEDTKGDRKEDTGVHGPSIIYEEIEEQEERTLSVSPVSTTNTSTETSRSTDSPSPKKRAAPFPKNGNTPDPYGGQSPDEFEENWRRMRKGAQSKSRSSKDYRQARRERPSEPERTVEPKIESGVIAELRRKLPHKWVSRVCDTNKFAMQDLESQGESILAMVSELDDPDAVDELCNPKGIHFCAKPNELRLELKERAKQAARRPPRPPYFEPEPEVYMTDAEKEKAREMIAEYKRQRDKDKGVRTSSGKRGSI